MVMDARRFARPPPQADPAMDRRPGRGRRTRFRNHSGRNEVAAPRAMPPAARNQSTTPASYADAAKSGQPRSGGALQFADHALARSPCIDNSLSNIATASRSRLRREDANAMAMRCHDHAKRRPDCRWPAAPSHNASRALPRRLGSMTRSPRRSTAPRKSAQPGLNAALAQLRAEEFGESSPVHGSLGPIVRPAGGPKCIRLSSI